MYSASDSRIRTIAPIALSWQQNPWRGPAWEGEPPGEPHRSTCPARREPRPCSRAWRRTKSEPLAAAGPAAPPRTGGIVIRKPSPFSSAAPSSNCSPGSGAIGNPMPSSLFEIAIEIGIETDGSSTRDRTSLVISHALVATPTIFSIPIAIAISVQILLRLCVNRSLTFSPER
jgi:hypothetical protein